MKRPTIADVARRAGVTKAAVSFALNGQPGVSAATRERILAIADEVGFKPSSAARALSDGKSGAFGLVIDRPARTLGIEPYFMQLISGIQAELSPTHVTLLFTMAEDQAAEIDMYRTWWAQRAVDGVFLVDLQVSDRRVAVLRELGMPTVVVGTPQGAGGLPAVWQDDRAATAILVGHLAGLGHQRIARVGGFQRYWHSKLRTDAFAAVAGEAGLEAVSVAADYTAEHGIEATHALLADPAPPTAILYDNDIMAIAALSAAQRAGLAVPGDLSIVAWGDSALCELVHPSVTALRWDTAEAGARAARLLSLAAGGGSAGSFQEGPPVLMIRGSTGPPGEARVPVRETTVRSSERPLFPGGTNQPPDPHPRHFPPQYHPAGRPSGPPRPGDREARFAIVQTGRVDAELRGELLRRMETDQTARRGDDPAATAAADTENLPWLKRVIGEVGWPGASLVGPDGAHAAWLLAQHADADPAFQRHCLDLLTSAVAAGEATRRELAYLTDRVLLAEGRPQEYGTQVTSRDGEYVPRNLRDPGNVDSRRASMDLEPLADYLRLFGPGSPHAARLKCPGCGELTGFDPPAGGEPVTVTCGGCGRTMRITLGPAW